MHVVRESSSGHPMSRREHSAKGRSKKSNWDLMGEGKGKGHLKADLDEKGQGKAGGWKEKSGGHKGYESTKKRKA